MQRPELMHTQAKAIWIGLTCSFLLVPALGFAQREQTTVPGYDKLPDWSGVWSMMGGTVFDRATQTGEGGAISVGVRSHPPYTAEWEAIYKAHLDLRDKDQFPDTISNCGVPAGFPRHFNLPDLYEFVVRPEQVWVLTENGPNIMRIYTDGRKHLEDQWETYTGDSVGHWEGDTLLFTTVALKGSRDNDSILDRTGLILSDKARATTRVQKTDANTIRVQMTI